MLKKIYNNMKLGDTVINSISTKINFRFYFGMVNNEMREYKKTKLYHYALDILLIEPNYRQYGFR